MVNFFNRWIIMKKRTLKNTSPKSEIRAAELSATNLLMWINGIDWNTLPSGRAVSLTALATEAKKTPDLHPANTSGSRKRVLEVLELVREALRYETEGEIWHGKWGAFPSDWPERLRLQMEIVKQVAFVHECLNVQTTLVPNSRGVLDFSSAILPCRTRPMGEAEAVHSLFRLARSGHLARVRKCNCDIWFFAGRMDQESCSTSCRRKAYESTDEYKAKRKPYFAEHYRKHIRGRLDTARESRKHLSATPDVASKPQPAKKAKR
jgi:hypothetical protein